MAESPAIQNDMKKSVTLACLLIVLSVNAQHEHHLKTVPDTLSSLAADTAHAHSEMMSSSYSRNLPMNRDGSGTSWQPDETPMMMFMLMKKRTMLMWHGAITPRLTVQDVFRKSNRGGARFSAPNWGMFMVNRYIGKHGLFNFSGMFSLDLLTEYNGYPLLFQSGETYNGKPLVDRQHPHDLFAGLSVAYTHSFTKDIDLSAYFGYPGEPALGPVAFMHRASAVYNPDAPLGHHWQDATHITFGIATLGFRYKIIKVESSIFTGREPDEKRYDFDRPRFDSYSYRVWVNPIKQLSMQFSQGFIRSPEFLEPDVHVMRTTASISHSKKFSKSVYLISTAVWGYNRDSENHNLHSVLAESTIRLSPCAIYYRYEWVQKNEHELQLSGFGEQAAFNIHSLALGLNVPIVNRANCEFSVGTQVTGSFPDSNLQTVYGRYPISSQIYLRLSPAINR